MNYSTVIITVSLGALIFGFPLFLIRQKYNQAWRMPASFFVIGVSTGVSFVVVLLSLFL
ncbi:hypothetical protein [Thermomonas sp.]